ncbi:sensor histidine kinase [Corynebacterium marinum]|uniref:histidine kinase n=1 Tax=Corynebacterium marinum DSM 44953 TaxID=1224162 RepID=A0A0B6TR80_9CORY|nr:sensor histidine kinase [Corynebacterium marinum]AJK68095.1 signal transduction histidine kinase [Corynebacterium marinum DSM 44953]GGO10841.1 histidine kinase [Corynebacterium marinum]
MRFGTRVLLLQLVTVVAVVAASAGVFIVLGVEQLKHETETSALSIARTVASAPVVRSEVTRETSRGINPSAAELADGPLQAYARDVTGRTGALFVVITDGEGIRMAHPDPGQLDRQVSTSFEAALRGEEVIAWERGTLGDSVRAKVPVFAPGTEEPVGEVSVGFERAGVFDDLPQLLLGVGAAAAAALLIGIGATLVLRRRWEQLTLGVQPEELVVLVQNQAAVLDGVGDGVIALDESGVIRVSNSEAEKMFGRVQLEGMSLGDLDLPEDVIRSLEKGEARDGVVVGGRVLYLDSRQVDRGGQRLGSVIILRDRTDVMGLSRRLDSVRTMTSALRVQRHEFANRMHVAAGLVESGRGEEAAEFLRTMRDRGPVDYPLAGADLLTEPFLQSFLGAKSLEADERGVQLLIRDETLVLGSLEGVEGVEDTATVLGNLVDNAVTAALQAPEPRLVEVTLMDDGPDLVLMVADSGPGTAAGTGAVAAPPADDETEETAVDRVHGHGIGLALSRDLLRRRGGELWLIDPGGGASGRGAVFGARLPGVMATGVAGQSRNSREEDE